MPAVQNAFPLRQDAYVPGQAINSHYRSGTAVIETAAGVGFAQPIAQGVNDDGCVLMAAGLTLLGITRLDRGRAAVDGGLYIKGAPASYFITGDVAVLSDAACAKWGQAYWNPATGRYSTSNAAGMIQVPNWFIYTTATAAGQLMGIQRGR